MRTRDGPGATYSATGTGGADDGNGVVGSANGSGVQNELRHGEVEIVEATERSMEAAAKQSVPLKVMVFVDGTWLYYSFYGRLVNMYEKVKNEVSIRMIDVRRRNSFTLVPIIFLSFSFARVWVA